MSGTTLRLNDLESCAGYQSLRSAILADVRSGWSEEERMKKLHFAVDRAAHYAEKTGLSASEILDAWESRRNYWYVNYYQDANQPLIAAEKVRVFETPEALGKSVGTSGFRCPNCKGVSRSPYECDSGLPTDSLPVCNWKVYGLFRDLGHGVHVFVKSELRGELIFFPVAWEADASQSEH